MNLRTNKTQRQLCKRLAGPFILFPGLVWSEKEFHFGRDHEEAVNNHFPEYWAIFGMVTNKQTNDQPGDPRASLLLTSEKAVFCNSKDRFSHLRFESDPILLIAFLQTRHMDALAGDPVA